MNKEPQTSRSSARAEEKPIIKLGLDVHARQITVCRQVEGKAPEAAQRLSVEGVLGWVRRMIESGAEVWCCYEAGPCGYVLHRQLTALGAHNLVVAPQRWDERGQQVKTDRRDARELVDRLDRYLRGNLKVFSVVRVPTPEQEQRRSLVRQRATVLKERQRCELRGGGLMLSQGVHARPGWWRPKLWEQTLAQLPEWLRESVGYWRAQAVRFEAEVEVLAQKVQRLSAGQAVPKGLGALTWAILQSEVLDWHRFTNRRQVGGYTGMCPREHSSGDSRQQGSINRHGNPRVRHQLVEAVWRLEQWQPDYAPLQKLRAAKGSRARRRAVVAIARRLAIDLWRLATGQTTAEKLRLQLMPAPVE